MVDLLEAIRTNMHYLVVGTPECRAESDAIVAYLSMYGERCRSEVLLSGQSVDIRALLDGTSVSHFPCVFRGQKPIGGLSKLRALFASEQRMDID